MGNSGEQSWVGWCVNRGGGGHYSSPSKVASRCGQCQPLRRLPLAQPLKAILEGLSSLPFPRQGGVRRVGRGDAAISVVLSALLSSGANRCSPHASVLVHGGRQHSLSDLLEQAQQTCMWEHTHECSSNFPGLVQSAFLNWQCHSNPGCVLKLPCKGGISGAPRCTECPTLYTAVAVLLLQARWTSAVLCRGWGRGGC